MTLDYAFAADVYLFNGDDILSGYNGTYIRSGVTYQYPILISEVNHTVWILVIPENQYFYNIQL